MRVKKTKRYQFPRIVIHNKSSFRFVFYRGRMKDALKDLSRISLSFYETMTATQPYLQFTRIYSTCLERELSVSLSIEGIREFKCFSDEIIFWYLPNLDLVAKFHSKPSRNTRSALRREWTVEINVHPAEMKRERVE